MLFPRLLTSALILACLSIPAAAAADKRRPLESDLAWDALHEASRGALAEATRRAPGTGAGPSGTDASPPRMILVGFTGGLESRDSAVSGVVRIRDHVEHRLGGAPGVTLRTYNNFRWREAARDVLADARPLIDRAETPPAVVVYGHSWGGGSIGKFARALGAHGVPVALAIYIDAFSVRNPRVPGNVEFAVNFYQRSGLLRGLPLRGKRQLVPESSGTTLLGSYRIDPQTAHFGWHWNLVQPLLYRHHHRISHDVRLQRYLAELAELHVVRTAGPAHPAP